MRRAGALPVLAALTGLALTVVAAPASAASRHGVVSGRVTRAETGRPLAGVQVVLDGTRRVVTDAEGRYRFATGTGPHDLTVETGNPCVVPAQPRHVDVPATGPAERHVGFPLATRTDRFGYACTPGACHWVDTSGGTLLSPADGNRELALPFAFPYYGGTYRQLQLYGPGLLGIGPAPSLTSTGSASPIPSATSTNGAISALAGPLGFDRDSTYSYVSDAHRFVFTFAGMTVTPTDRRVTFQVQLTDDGTIDLVYGDVDAVDRTAPFLVGFESPDGTDAYTFAHRELPTLSNTAWRFRPAATSAVTGAVLNANDLRPVAEATVTADPGGRSATTDSAGRYLLTLIPGRYTISIDAPGYGTATTAADTRGRPTVKLPTLRLAAPDAHVVLDDPHAPGIDLTAAANTVASLGITVLNNGGRPLAWDLYTHDKGTDPTPSPPPAPEPTLSPIASRRVPMTRLADDPPNGYGFGDDLLALDGGATADTVRARIVLTPTSTFFGARATLYFDTDHDPTTGVTQTYDRIGRPVPLGLGADRMLSFDGPLSPVPLSGHQELTFELPRSPDGGPAARPVDVVAVLTDRHGTIQDRVPDTGPATIVPELAAPWLDVPQSGMLAPGGTIRIPVTVLVPGPGEHYGELRFETDDPRHPTIRIPVALHATAPVP